MTRAWCERLAALAFLALAVLCAMLGRADASGMAAGENWLGGTQSPTQDLAAYGGTVYQRYDAEPTADGEPNRVRLLRYPWRSVTQAQVAAMHTRGLTWLLGNEANSRWQDGGLTTDVDAVPFVQWYAGQVTAIRSADPTARIVGPSVIGWTAYCCAPDIVTGSQAYTRFLTVYQQQYGSLPFMHDLNFHFYPQTSYGLPETEPQLASETQQAAAFAHAHGWGIAVTEWSHWAEHFDPTCTPAGQSEADRYHYTLTGLQTFASLGVTMALYFGNVHQACDQNGHAAWLFNNDGSLTVEGRAHRDFVYGTPTPVATLTPSPTVTATPSATVTATLTATSTPALTPTLTLTPTATRTVTATPSMTRYPCIPSYVRRCP